MSFPRKRESKFLRESTFLGEKMRKLLVAALMVVLASPAFAAIQNVKVSGDITTTWLDRNDFDLGMASPTAIAAGLKSQNVFLTQTRLRVDADLSDNVSTTVGLINERAWNAENGTNGNQDTNVQLYLASVTMRELLYSPLTVTVGRQIFTYGNGLIMGNGPNNLSGGNLQYIAQDLTMRTAEDGVKAVLDYKPLTIDMFYFKNSQSAKSIQGLYSQNGASSDVYGINANYQLSDPWNTVLEGYLFGRINGNALAGGAATSDKGDTLYVPGLRVSTNPIKGLNVQGELAWQAGNHPVVVSGNNEAEHREAMAAQVQASYSLPVLEKYKPTVNASYTYVSGDKNGNTNYGTDAVKSAKVFTAWDPMFENQGAGTIYNTLFPLSNMHILAIGASANPLEDVNVSATWSGLWAADRYTNGGQNPLYIYQPNDGSGVLAPVTTSNNKRFGLGNEYDLNLNYNYTEDVTFGVSVGWFVPGSVFDDANKSTASQAIVDLGVKF
jgi:hypothetical protein